MPHKTLFTEEHVQFILTVVKGRPRSESLQLVNDKFGLDVKMNQWIAYLKNHKITSGYDARYKPGNVPHSKGKKGTKGWQSTQFKPGQRSHNYMPVGSERVNTDGYMDIKIADPGKWRAKHLIVWERENGPIPEGHVVIFGDQDRMNLDPDNLILITRKQLSIMNQHHLIQPDADATRTGIIVADIYAKMVERSKK